MQKSPAQTTEGSITEVAEFESHMPYMGLDIGDLTVQQEKLVMLVLSGMSLAAAGRGAGYSNSSAVYDAVKRPKVVKALAYFREQMHEEVKFTAANAHIMYMDAYQASANATEMKNTVDSLVKLHGLGTPDNATQVNINIDATPKQLERMSDEELLKIAGKDAAYLEPSADE